VLISDRALIGSDTLVTSRVLAAGITRLAPYDLIMFGMRSSDSDTGQVGPQTATLLKLPFLSGIHRWEHHDGRWTFGRIMDDWEEEWRAASPAAVTVLHRAFTPRPIPLAGFTTAIDHPTDEIWGLDDIHLAPGQVGLEGSPTRVASQKRIKHTRKCQLISGEPNEQIGALMAQLNTMGLIES